MPLQRCRVNGEKGWKYGKHGKCYVGSDGREKAVKQGQAIEINRHSNIEEALVKQLKSFKASDELQFN